MTTATATALDLENMTTGEAKLTLDKVIKQISEQTGEILVASDDVKTIAYALENNIQLRDYLMGLTNDGLSVESVANILRVMVVLIKQEELPAYPVQTVLASYMYRLGESKLANGLLSSGLEKDYSLAKLLSRVFIAGWPADSFATMANDLHAKVVQNIQDDSEKLVNEANR
jgi:hypothetical protein